MRESAVLRRLGQISVAQFMRDYWQRKPCLIRSALPGFVAPIDRKRAFELARSPHVESRLVTSFDRRWNVELGPFARLPSVRRDAWTLLVHGVDLHDDSARRLLSRFRFVPDARLDDLMVSYATDGGGVGAHVDSYDVFLLQAFGQRRWRISRQRELQTAPGSPLRQVKGFRASAEWLLDPGDMLYLPPGVAHEGVAAGECVTYSIGFRAPFYQQILEPWFADYAEHSVLRGWYTDPDAAAVSHAASVPAAMILEVHHALSVCKPAPADTERFLLRYLTEPKASTVFETPRNALPLQAFKRLVRSGGLEPDRRTRIMYSRRAIAINGEWIKARTDWMPLKRLADRRELTAELAARLPASAWTLLHDWHTAGWIKLIDGGRRKLDL